MKWLWAEDQPKTVGSLSNKMQESGIQLLKYATLNEMIDFIIDQKTTLTNYGLLLDVLFTQQKDILIPQAWSEKDEEIIQCEDDGKDAGLLFFEKIVLGRRESLDTQTYWYPPPPVIFLTVANLENTEYEMRLNGIKKSCSDILKIPISKVKVDWMRKSIPWSKIINQLKEYAV